MTRATKETTTTEPSQGDAQFRNAFDQYVGEGAAIPLDDAPDATVGLSPDSLIWEFVGDWRVAFFGFQRIAGIETSIEQIGQGLYEHSRVWTDVAGRGRRTAYNMMQVIYSDSQDHWGGQIRDFHKPVKGTMPDGSRYHALNPELWYWIHATFVDLIIYGTDTFIRRLSHEEKAQIFEESKGWYRLYGISDRAQPDTYEEFLEYWDDMVARAVPTQTVMHGTGYIRRGLPRPRRIPRVVWNVVSAPLNAYTQTMLVGTLPPHLREVCGLEWSDQKERRFQRATATLRALNPVISRLPMRLRYNSHAVRAFERTGVKPGPARLPLTRKAGR